ncbi:UvrD-helicase domain-containing protein [Massilia pseudoviolaceinigra]|uniref:UvrD-helicase domain-containing protein n=1 Tax=Massilia pseudoviolaceinigra TaxID=3057165 RepID=UPI002796DD4D|nr:UvrD-helicase domain-containing protein [Massilia sp. CCM 9206]MDQ1924349.1 UvrD-helicase domain-containing protein [Massilia sp. CCM 9206]
MSFDDAQQAVYVQNAPLIIVGSAGSGKTALTLEKMKQAQGDVLYVTHSAYLAQSARDLYYADGFEQAGQEAAFLSYREFLESVRVPHGREATWRDFSAWFARMRQQFKGIDAHQAFEEIRGVLAADAAGVLDLNLVAHDWRPEVQPRYDFVVVDEVQDLTVAQLALVLQALRKPGQFLLCGDSNQIVHPNFFSWSKVKSLFWRDPELAERQQLQVLRANFRNGTPVTRPDVRARRSLARAGGTGALHSCHASAGNVDALYWRVNQRAADFKQVCSGRSAAALAAALASADAASTTFTTHAVSLPMCATTRT